MSDTIDPGAWMSETLAARDARIVELEEEIDRLRGLEQAAGVAVALQRASLDARDRISRLQSELECVTELRAEQDRMYQWRGERIAELEQALRDNAELVEISVAWHADANEARNSWGRRVAALEAALDAWLDWDRTAESDTSDAILERARALTDAALLPKEEER